MPRCVRFLGLNAFLCVLLCKLIEVIVIVGLSLTLYIIIVIILIEVIVIVGLSLIL